MAIARAKKSWFRAIADSPDLVTLTCYIHAAAECGLQWMQARCKDESSMFLAFSKKLSEVLYLV